MRLGTYPRTAERGEIDAEIQNAHQEYLDAERELERVALRRAYAFALAGERGYSSGRIARLTGATPAQAAYQMRIGKQLIMRQRRREALREAA